MATSDALGRWAEVLYSLIYLFCLAFFVEWKLNWCATDSLHISISGGHLKIESHLDMTVRAGGNWANGHESHPSDRPTSKHDRVVQNDGRQLLWLNQFDANLWPSKRACMQFVWWWNELQFAVCFVPNLIVGYEKKSSLDASFRDGQ